MKTIFLIKSKLLTSFQTIWCRVVIILLLGLSITFFSQAQNKIWDKTFGGGSTDGLSAIVATPDGGYLLGGTSASRKSGDKSEAKTGYWVVKMDGSGKKLWDKAFSTGHLTALVATTDGGYLLGGNSSSDKGGDKSEDNKGKTLNENGVRSKDYWLVKIDAQGKKVWDKTLGGKQEDNLSAIVATADGGYLMGGSSKSGKSGDKSDNNWGTPNENGDYPSDYWIIKIDASGKKLWDKTFGGKDNDGINALVGTLDGGYLLGGTSISGISGDKSEANRASDGETDDYWVIKINSNGKKIWDKTIGGNHYDFFQAIVATPDRGFLLGGTSFSGKSGEKSEDNKYPQDESGNVLPAYWIVKIDAGGKKIWDKNYGTEGHNLFSDELKSIISSPEGGYVLGGVSNGEKGVDKSEDKVGYWVIKLKEDGTKIWDRTFADGNNYNGAPLSTMVATSDRGILLGGTSASGIGQDKSEASRGQQDYWIVKVGNSNKKVQEITLPPLITKTFGDAPFTLSAQASSGLPATFSLVSGPGTLKNNTLTLTGVGRIIVRASQAGDATYAAATAVLQTILVEAPTPVTKVWDKSFGGNNQDLLGAVVATPEGGYLLGGTFQYGRVGHEDLLESGYLFVKINKEGTKIWDLALDAFAPYGIILSYMLVTPDGGFLVGGTQNWLGDINEIFKISSNGTREWHKTFNGNEHESFSELTPLVATPDGGYLLGGYSTSNKGGDKSEDSRGGADYWIVKIDGQGNKLWDKTYGGESNDFLFALVPTQDGGYLLGGTSNSNKSGDKSENSRGGNDYWVVKIDATGKKIWDKTLGGNGRDGLAKMVATPEDGYLLGGNSSSAKSGEKSQASKGDNDYWIIKLDGIGKKVWDKTLGGNQEDDLKALVATSNGGYLLGGSSASSKGEDKSEPSRGSTDYWVVKVDATGQKIWDKTFGTSKQDNFSALVASTNNSYLLGGFTNAGIDGDKSEPILDNKPNQSLKGDYWIVRIKEDLPVTVTWNLRYGGSSSDYLTTILPTHDGGYLLGGYSSSNKSGDKSQPSYGKNDYWVVKTDAAGQKLWDKRYGGTGEDYLKSIVPTPEGGYLLGGSSESGSSGNKTAPSKGGRDFWLIKISSSGEKEWDYSYGGRGTEDLKKVRVLPDGTYLLAGYSNSSLNGNKSQSSRGGLDYWLVKINTKGERLWDKRYGGTGDDYLEDVLVLANGDLLLGGGSFSSQGGDRSQASQGSSDYWLVRTDGTGKKLWDKRYGGSEQDHLFSLLSTHNDSILIAGQSASPKSGNKSQPTQGKKDYWLLQVNGKGDPQWDKTYGGSREEALRTLSQDKAGGYLLGGSSSSGKSGDKSQFSQGGSDYWLVKTNTKGNKLWDRRFGGSQEEELRAVWPTEDGGYLLGGRSSSGVSGDRTQPSQGENDFWLVKVAPRITSTIAVLEATKRQEAAAELKLNQLKVYPNPFRERVNIRFTLANTQVASVKVHDNQGRVIATLFQGQAQAHQTYQLEWQAGDKAAGMYLLRLHTLEQNYSAKLLLKR